jgi:hypothetical protein
VGCYSGLDILASGGGTVNATVVNNKAIDNGMNFYLRQMDDFGTLVWKNNTSIIYDTTDCMHTKIFIWDATGTDIDTNHYYPDDASEIEGSGDKFETNYVTGDPKLPKESGWTSLAGSGSITTAQLFPGAGSALIDVGLDLGTQSNLAPTSGTDFHVLPDTETFSLFDQDDYGTDWEIGAFVTETLYFASKTATNCSGGVNTDYCLGGTYDNQCILQSTCEGAGGTGGLTAYYITGVSNHDLQEAIDAAKGSGNTLYVRAGTYGGSGSELEINSDKELSVTEDFSLGWYKIVACYDGSDGDCSDTVDTQETVIIDPNQLSDYLFKINGADYFELDGIDLRNAYDDVYNEGACLYIYNAASYIKIRNVNIDDCAHKGVRTNSIYGTPNSNLLFENVHIDGTTGGNSAHGIRLMETVDVTIKDSSTTNTEDQGILVVGQDINVNYSERIYITNSEFSYSDNCGINTEPEFVRNLLIEDSTFHDNNRLSYCAEAAIRSNSIKTYVRNSTFYNNLTALGFSGQYNVSSRNIVYDNNYDDQPRHNDSGTWICCKDESDGAPCYGGPSETWGNQGGPGVQARENTGYTCDYDVYAELQAYVFNVFDNNGTTDDGCSAPSRKCQGDIQIGWATDVCPGETNMNEYLSFLGNVVYDHGGKYTVKLGLDSNHNYATMQIDYNAYYKPGGSAGFAYDDEWDDTTAVMNFAAWKAALDGGGIIGADANSIEADQKFWDPSNHVYFTKIDSPLIDAVKVDSSPVGITTVAIADTSSGTSLVVIDPKYFTPAGDDTDEFGMEGYEARGDYIAIDDSICVEVEKVNYSTNTLTLDSGISRQDGDQVYLCIDVDGDGIPDVAYYGDAPDINVFENPLDLSPTITSPSSLIRVAADVTLTMTRTPTTDQTGADQDKFSLIAADHKICSGLSADCSSCSGTGSGITKKTGAQALQHQVYPALPFGGAYTYCGRTYADWDQDSIADDGEAGEWQSFSFVATLQQILR